MGERMSDVQFPSAREALKAKLKEHEDHERFLDERICEICALGTWQWGSIETDDYMSVAAALSYGPRRMGGGKIVALAVNLSRDGKEYECPACGTFEEFLGLRRRYVS
jgi:hypothetical protein